jgi:hypothetical protein
MQLPAQKSYKKIFLLQALQIFKKKQSSITGIRFETVQGTDHLNYMISVPVHLFIGLNTGTGKIFLRFVEI